MQIKSIIYDKVLKKVNVLFSAHNQYLGCKTADYKVFST